MLSQHEPAHRVQILEKQPGVPVILLDGQEVRTAVAATLSLNVDRPPILRLALLAIDGMGADVHARVMLDDATTAALVAMGWTPPAEVTLTGC